MIGFNGGGSKNSSLGSKKILSWRLHEEKRKEKEYIFLKGKTQGYTGELGSEIL
jgi:hypothetical protein